MQQTCGGLMRPPSHVRSKCKPLRFPVIPADTSGVLAGEGKPLSWAFGKKYLLTSLIKCLAGHNLRSPQPVRSPLIKFSCNVSMDDIKNKTMTEILVVFKFSCALLLKRLQDLKMWCVSVSLNRWLKQFCKKAKLTPLPLLLPLLAASLDNAWLTDWLHSSRRCSFHTGLHSVPLSNFIRW